MYNSEMKRRLKDPGLIEYIVLVIVVILVVVILRDKIKKAVEGHRYWLIAASEHSLQ